MVQGTILFIYLLMKQSSTPNFISPTVFSSKKTLQNFFLNVINRFIKDRKKRIFLLFINLFRSGHENIVFKKLFRVSGV